MAMTHLQTVEVLGKSLVSELDKATGFIYINYDGQCKFTVDVEYLMVDSDGKTVGHFRPTTDNTWDFYKWDSVGKAIVFHQGTYKGATSIFRECLIVAQRLIEEFLSDSEVTTEVGES